MQDMLNRIRQLLSQIFEKKWARVTTFVIAGLVLLGNIGSYVSPAEGSEPTTIGALVATCILSPLAIFIAYYFGKGSNTSNPQVKRKLTDDEKALVKKVKEAKKHLANASRTQKKALAAAKKELAELQDPKGRRVAAGGGVQVFQRWVVTPQGSGSIIGVTASAEDNTSINKRITATRLVGLGVFALAAPKKKGGGNAYVVIEGPHISGVATFTGDKQQSVGPKAFALAASINNAARQAASDEPHRPSRITSVKDKISVIESAPEIATASLAVHSAIESLPPDLQSIYR
jgi:hypothetical protein